MSTIDFQKDMKIDPETLDIDWIRHPAKYMHYSEESAKANDRVRRFKHDLEVIDARLDQEIRISMEGEGKKITEASIKNMTTADERHLKATLDYNDALHEADLYSAAVKAMDHKKTALQALVQLWAGSYFAGPKTPRDLRKEMNVQVEATQAQKADVQERAERRMRANKSEEVN